MDFASRAGLYLHVPFCRRKCGYCSFFSFVPERRHIRCYLAAVRGQMAQLATLDSVRQLRFATLFFGGGTPSVLAPEELAGLLADCRRLFSFSTPEPECTIEVNPATIDRQGLALLRRAGFNRLSIGMQALDDDQLAGLGRLHTANQALATIDAARRAGFERLSFDLMYGLPGQSAPQWRRTLELALAKAPEHLSLYELTVEEHTPLADQVSRDQVRLPSEEEILAMMAVTEAALVDSPLRRYEISNYAVTGSECRHNLNYWHNGLYLGIGPGAVSALADGRRENTADLKEFADRIQAGHPAWEEVERLSPEAAFRETVVMGLRLVAGVSLAELTERFGIEAHNHYGAIMSRLIDQGWLAVRHGRLHLTARALPLANRIMAELV